MDISVRSLRPLNRYLRNRFGFFTTRKITGAAALKEDINTSLLARFNEDIKKGFVVPVFRRALLFPTRVALQDEVGIYTYAGLHQAATALARDISRLLVGDTERTIPYMCSNDASHVIVQWAIWMSGNIAVPLTPLHPKDMLKYFVEDSCASLIVCTTDYETVCQPIAQDANIPLVVTTRDQEITAQLYQPNTAFLKEKDSSTLEDEARPNQWYGNTDAMLIYTSGTTNKPKGVVWTHSMLATQIAALHTAWGYSPTDVVLHTLPLHHIHGQLNSLNATLAIGARLRMLKSFVSHTVWARLLGMGEREDNKITVFHGVPAMYAKLSQDHEHMFSGERTAQYVRTTLSKMRLMCSGSAPLPESLARKWFEISGINLLERYGMTEAGMALSNPYRPAESRAVGSVGLPLPGVSARIAVPDENGQLQNLVTVETPLCDTSINLEGSLAKGSEGEVGAFDWKPSKVTLHVQPKDDCHQGELLLCGPGMFTRYWNRPPVLDSPDFTPDGWFRTGDVASFSDNKFKILGRTSVDIIKTGGYKVSALQVESAIMELNSVADVAVIGVDNEQYGETIAAVIVLKHGAELTLRELKAEAGKKLAPYQLPRSMITIGEMPRNTMGKLDKRVIKKMFSQDLVLKS